MHFLRFPGCSVGRAPNRQFSSKPGLTIPVLPNGAQPVTCHTFDGKSFWCDTDFSKREECRIESLVAETFERVLCFTGGEPLLHEDQEWFQDLFAECKMKGKQVHVETSGTRVPRTLFDWITVSPKYNWKPEAVKLANQVKFLVTKNTSLKEIESVVRAANSMCQFFLSPVFDPNELVRENVDKCFELLREFPGWRLSIQVHKFLGVR